MKDEIILYHIDSVTAHLEVKVQNESVWLNRQQLAILFDRDVKTIGKHINNSLKEELAEFTVVAKFATTALKDLGKKWFAFSVLDKSSVPIHKTINELI